MGEDVGGAYSGLGLGVEKLRSRHGGRMFARRKRGNFDVEGEYLEVRGGGDLLGWCRFRKSANPTLITPPAPNQTHKVGWDFFLPGR